MQAQVYASSACSAASHAAYNRSSQTPHAPFNPVSNVDGIGPEKLPRGQAEIQSLPGELFPRCRLLHLYIDHVTDFI